MTNKSVINRNMRFISICNGSRIFAIVVVVILLNVLGGCNKKSDLPAEAVGKVVVVATILPLADWARQVGGDLVHVETLLPPGASPHTFDPTPRDMRLISKASVFLKAGLHMDDWGSRLAVSGGKKLSVISVGDELLDEAKLPEVGHLDTGVETIAEGQGNHDHDHDHAHGNHNPHFWLDPQLAMESVIIVKDALVQADPENKEIYESNAAAYLDDLRELDKDLGTQLEPFSRRGFVSFHNAWPYFARRYHLKIAGVIEEYAGKAPGEKYLRTVTERLKVLGIKTIFSEPQLNPQVAQVIADEVGGRVAVLDPYGTEGTADRGSYVDNMRYNARQLIEAFEAE